MVKETRPEFVKIVSVSHLFMFLGPQVFHFICNKLKIFLLSSIDFDLRIIKLQDLFKTNLSKYS